MFIFVVCRKNDSVFKKIPTHAGDDNERASSDRAESSELDILNTAFVEDVDGLPAIDPQSSSVVQKQ